MAILEALLMTILTAILSVTSYTDLRGSVIENKHLLRCAVPAVLCDIVYYALWARDTVALFLINFAVLAVVGVLLYAFDLWAAGDCKLLLVVGLCIPGRFYSLSGPGFGVSFYILAIVFSLAFLYVVLESIVMGIRDRQLFKISLRGFDWKDAILSYLVMVGCLSLAGALLTLAFPSFSTGSKAVAVAVNFVLVLSLLRLRKHVSQRALMLMMILVWLALAGLAAAGWYQFKLGNGLDSWLIVLFVMLLRLISEKYNYQTIPTAEVKRGQILSAATVLSLSASRVHGLPTGSTEDLRSRLTEEEAESVRRWEHSTYGKPYVIIVRKLPFAIFIAVGTVLFLALEVLRLL